MTNGLTKEWLWVVRYPVIRPIDVLKMSDLALLNRSHKHIHKLI